MPAASIVPAACFMKDLRSVPEIGSSVTRLPILSMLVFSCSRLAPAIATGSLRNQNPVQLIRRFQVQIDGCIWMSPEDRRGTLCGDWFCEGTPHNLRLAFSGHRDNQPGHAE